MKVLVIRFSSIGDIVLTTPVIRCLREQVPDVEIHYCTKEQYAHLLEPNPHISRIIKLGSSFRQMLDELKLNDYDLIVDLHHNLRSLRIKTVLFRTRSVTFHKINFRKWITVLTKRSFLPDLHIVDRYIQTLKMLGVKYDGRGLDYFFPDFAELPGPIAEILPKNPFVALVAGGTYFTKQIPPEIIKNIIRKVKMPVVLLGDGKDQVKAQLAIEGQNFNALNLCGKLSLSQSALVLKGSAVVISSDTGLMHIAAALGKPLISIWGNTIPEFGMSPLFDSGKSEYSYRSEVLGLACRPCSKLGFDNCPKGHFNCMNQQNTQNIAEKAESLSRLVS